MKSTPSRTLRRIGVSLAVATAITAQLAGVAPGSAYAEGNGNKPVVVKPRAESITDAVKEKKPGDPVNTPLPDYGPITGTKPDKKIPDITDAIDTKPDLPMNPDLLKRPDLRVDGLSVQLGAGNGQCDPAQTTIIAEIKNDGQAKAGAFGVRLTVDGDDLDGGYKEIDGLAIGAGMYVTFNGVALPQGSHSLKVIADANDQTLDNKTNNNSKSTNFNCQSVAAPMADVQVSSFVVEGKNDQVADCDPGKNQIYAIVRNNGGAAAGPFAVRMLADGEEPENGTEMVGGLDAGQETIVQFGTVKLKAGDHTLRVIADPDYALSDSDTGNNYKEMPITCAKE